MKIALCQINPIPANVAFNVGRILEEIRAAASAGADLAVFPELAIPGYPPRDMLDYPGFLESASNGLDSIRAACRECGISAAVGTVRPNHFPGKKPLLNACAMIRPDGKIDFTWKKLLPTYDVFDEERYFAPCPPDEQPPVALFEDADGRAVRVGCTICEDIWNDNEFYRDQRLYPVNPIQALVEKGVDVILNISASPFVRHKPALRMAMLKHVARRWDKTIIHVNQAGGCDQVIFDGGSCAVKPDGAVTAAAGWFTEESVTWNSGCSSETPGFPAMLEAASDEIHGVVSALTMGLRDYLRKTGFSQVLVGNSGGIDSAVVLSLATRALGQSNVISVTMPSRYSSAETRGDAGTLAENLGIRHVEIPIETIHQAFSTSLAAPGSSVVESLFEGEPEQMSRLADENVQARIRGTILMYLSNAIGSPRTILLSTGNKSELAVGYCTLYGDMCGGLALISDVPKTMVYRIAEFLNREMGPVIPEGIIRREPSAELAPDQKDSDNLPSYPVLDAIIQKYIEEHAGEEEIIRSGIADTKTVGRVIRLINNAEYKRAQAAPGLKVTSKAFGVGRRIPIARG